MSHSRSILAMASLMMMCAMTAQAQLDGKPDLKSAWNESASIGEVLHLVRYEGVIPEVAGMSRPNVAGITFSLYADQNDGTPLWMETQNVQVDEEGHYTTLLGATKTEGVPVELFAAGQARWLGVQVSGELVETRTPLGSVPYAVKSGDAQTLGGRSVEEFVLAEHIQTQIRDELQAAGFDIPESGSAGHQFRTQDHRDGHPPPPNPPPPSTQDKLDMILAILREPDPVFSFSLCTEPAGNFEVAGTSEVALDGTIEGRVGAEGYGNGAMVRLKGTPKGKIETDVKFSWDFLKLGICADLRAAVQRVLARSDGAVPLRTAGAASDNHVAANGALLDHIAAIDQDALLAQMLGVADNLQMDPAKLQTALDRITNLSFDGGPFAALRDNPDRAVLIETLPIPAGVKEKLMSPASLLETLQEFRQQGLCNIPDLPPAVDNAIGPVCDLVANEPFAQLLDRVDTITGTINSRVNTINNIVTNIRDRLPIDGDCKLFC